MGKKIKSAAKGLLSFHTGGLSTAAEETGKAVGRQLDKLNPDLPEQPNVLTAPVADDQALQKANKRALARKRSKRGRAGTMLTEESTLG